MTERTAVYHCENREHLALLLTHEILIMGDGPAIGRVGRFARRCSPVVVSAAAARIGLRDADLVNVTGRVLRSRWVLGFQCSAPFVGTDPLRGMTERVDLFLGAVRVFRAFAPAQASGLSVMHTLGQPRGRSRSTPYGLAPGFQDNPRTLKVLIADSWRICRTTSHGYLPPGTIGTSGSGTRSQLIE